MAEAEVPVVSIEHVGSTSVPDLAAKPIIDYDIVVEAEQVILSSEVLERLGFIPRGELGAPQRWAFYEPEHLSGTNTYVVVAGSLALKNHLAVRDVLCDNDALRAECGVVKLSIGGRQQPTSMNTGSGRTPPCREFLKRQTYRHRSGRRSTPTRCP